jgi:cytochrome P450
MSDLEEQPRRRRVDSVEMASITLLDPSAYADGRLFEACALLRQKAPVAWVEAEGFRPFHALTKYDDVREVERQHELFHAGPRHRLVRSVDEAHKEVARTLISMDPPEHTAYRALAADWFHPRHLRTLEDNVRALARASVDQMAANTDPYDFVPTVSMQYPLQMICSMLGIPPSERGTILRLTQRSFGSEDEEYQRLTRADDNTPPTAEFVAYFAKIIQMRRTEPSDDLSSMLVHAQVDGQPLGPVELLGYLGILATAGHDTTSSTIAGGLQALIEHPEELDRLRSDVSLVPNAVEEMIRWTTPVNSFMRVATEETSIRGRTIAPGEAVLLLYPSANRDEEIFEDPDRFDVGRDPNPHLAFGHGAHFCLGARLARLEARAFFEELIPRLRNVELTGRPEMVKTLFVGGLKHLPIRADVS